MDREEKKSIHHGLTAKEAARRLKKYGENAVFKKKKMRPFLIFVGKFRNPLMLLLITISLVSFGLGQRASAVIVLMMVFLSTILDFFSSYKSQKAVLRLIAAVATKISVRRDGGDKEIDLKDIVPGDIVFLSAGSIIPADCEILESDDFFVNEAALTGESMPTEKIALDKNREAGGENLSRVFMGTSVITGFATARVTLTGAGTQFGKIAGELAKAEPKTDFEISITKFSFFILKLVIIMSSIVFVAYLIKNADNLNKVIILQAFTFSLAITIGVTPDILPAIMTICLSKGSQLMARKNVIVKQLAAIENFGSMDILCTDKTGTLTQDRITLIKYLDSAGQDAPRVLELGHLSSYFHTGVKNPLDHAINAYKKIDVSAYKKIDEIPYDFERKRSSMVVEKDGRRLLVTKGAPEEILKICERYEIDGRPAAIDDARPKIGRKFSELSEDGFRVLGLCYKDLPLDAAKTYNKATEQGMIFAGFLAFLDPPKEGVRQTIAELEQLGIEVKILTGDNDLLTRKICREIGLEITAVLTGRDIDGMNDVTLQRAAIEANIFARINPEQKERVILILQKAGKAVGFLCDGINDAPSLKAADVGISVNNAVDIAKDTADIILMEKSLESLKDGIMEGRRTFHNTLKYVLMGLSSNFGNMFSMMGAVAFLPFLPMLPAQILFNNFLYDISQFSLPTDAVDGDELLKPAHWDLHFIRKYMIVFGWISSIFDFLTFFLLYYVYHLTEHQFQTGWFIESIAAQIFVIYIIRTKKIPFLESRPSLSLMITTISAVIAAWLVQFTFFGRLLEFDRLPLYIMAIIASYVLVYLVLVEAVKRVFYRLHAKAAAKQASA
jgi:P-type Mg2+ transporter